MSGRKLGMFLFFMQGKYDSHWMSSGYFFDQNWRAGDISS